MAILIHQFASNLQTTGRIHFLREVAHEQGEETNDAGERGVSEDEIDEPPAILSKLSRRLSREDRSIILFMDNAPCQPVFVQDWSCLAY